MLSAKEAHERTLKIIKDDFDINYPIIRAKVEEVIETAMFKHKFNVLFHFSDYTNNDDIEVEILKELNALGYHIEREPYWTLISWGMYD